MTKNFFEVKNVDFNVAGKTKVKNVSFSIKNEGDVVCLLGPSGIGKTTILRTIAGLEKIDNGSIELSNKTLSSKSTYVEPENRNISLAFQDNSLFPHYTVEKNILLGAERNKGKKEKKISILLASHNMEEVRRLCGSVMMMKNGEIIDRGTPSGLIKKHGRTNLEEVFLKLARTDDEL